MQDMIDKMMVECKLFLDKNDCACLLKEWKRMSLERMETLSKAYYFDYNESSV